MSALVVSLTALIIAVIAAIIAGIYCVLVLTQAAAHWLVSTGRLADAIRNDLPGLSAVSLWATLIAHLNRK